MGNPEALYLVKYTILIYLIIFLIGENMNNINEMYH